MGSEAGLSYRRAWLRYGSRITAFQCRNRIDRADLIRPEGYRTALRPAGASP